MNMKKAVVAFLGSALMSGMLVLPNAVFSQTAPTAPPATSQPGQGKWQGHEHHPEIRHAMRHLREAKRNLEHGAHDFGGHRAQALQLVEQALQQCEQALQDDKH